MCVAALHDADAAGSTPFHARDVERRTVMEFSLKASTYWGRPTALLTHSATLFPCDAETPFSTPLNVQHL